MYYFCDYEANLQGPYPEETLEKWYENEELPTGCLLVDSDKKKTFRIEEMIAKRIKSKAKVMFFDETMGSERSMEQTNLDVTLELSESWRHNDSTHFQPDFTQISEGVDEVDFGRDSERDKGGAKLQRAVGDYVSHRALNNCRRRFPDCYVPLESGWNRAWIMEPLSMSEAFRCAVNVHNHLQEFHDDEFSDYLHSINIRPHACSVCSTDFHTAFEMLLHFCSVMHVQRIYNTTHGCLSKIDFHCIFKMISEVIGSRDRSRSKFAFEVNEYCYERKEPHFVERVDVPTAVDSLGSSVILMQSAPLFQLPKIKDDVCDYIEAFVLFREFEEGYHKSSRVMRGRRIGAGKIHCAYCKVDIDGFYLDALPKHIMTERHVQNSLRSGISRTEMEYWMSFFCSMQFGQSPHKNAWRHHQKIEPSLQEKEFPLCVKLTTLPRGDFVYRGSDLEPVLNQVRSEIRDKYPLLKDGFFRTTCRWCHVDLHSEMGALRHVLYDKSHLRHLEHVSNDDIRRLLKFLNIPVAIPLFKNSPNRLHQPLHPLDKKTAMQRLKNVIYRAHKRNAMRNIVSQSFPMGLVNWCDLCHVEVEHVESIMTHVCSEKHTHNVINASRIAEKDVDYWMAVFKVTRPNTRSQ